MNTGPSLGENEKESERQNKYIYAPMFALAGPTGHAIALARLIGAPTESWPAVGNS